MGAASSVALPEEDAAAPAAAAGLAAPEAAAAPSSCGEEDWSWQRVELGRYSVKGVDVLGVGAHCVVRRGVDTTTGAAVALKEYRGAGAGARLAREVGVMRRLSADGGARWFAAALDFTRDGTAAAGADPETGRCVVCLEVAEAGSLDEVVQRGAPQSAGRVAAMVRDVGGALDHMHGLGLVHGDVKPANVMRYDRGWRVIDVDDAIDAGTAVDCSVSAFFTELYAAPDVARAAADDATLVVRPAVDAWSLGVAALEMLHGAHPLKPAIDARGDAFLAWLAVLAQADVDAWLGAQGDGALPRVLRGACVVDPTARATAGDLARLASEIADDSFPDAPADRPPQQDIVLKSAVPEGAKARASAFSVFRDEMLPALLEAGADKKQATKECAQAWGALRKSDKDAAAAYARRADALNTASGG